MLAIFDEPMKNILKIKKKSIGQVMTFEVQVNQTL